MKKLGLVLLFVLPVSVMAQRSIGIKGGANYSKVTESVELQRWRTGAAFGVFGVTMLTRHLGVQAEILYSQKGGRMSTQAQDTLPAVYSENIRGRIDFVDIPLMLRFQAHTVLFRPYFNTGLGISAPIGHWVRRVPLEGQPRGGVNPDAVNVNYIAGVGAEIKLMDRLFWLVEGRYEQGITRIAMNQGKSTNLQALTGLRYRHGNTIARNTYSRQRGYNRPRNAM
ncbi:MAG: porin family protein [Cytophagaceae bacterium]